MTEVSRPYENYKGTGFSALKFGLKIQQPKADTWIITIISLQYKIPGLYISIFNSGQIQYKLINKIYTEILRHMLKGWMVLTNKPLCITVDHQPAKCRVHTADSQVDSLSQIRLAQNY